MHHVYRRRAGHCLGPGTCGVAGRMGALQKSLDEARRRYVAANPKSGEADAAAHRYLPGGNTRNVLHFEPYPLTIVGGEGAELIDLDGHRYVDFVGEYSAGIFGHSDPTIKAAIVSALDGGIALGAPTPYERQLARIICRRFPAIEQVRFCNSGTEAALMALTTARLVTGRDRVLAFHGAYHGGVVKFPTGLTRFNVPYDFQLCDYNDLEGTAEAIHQAGNQLAAVIVEPVLGAGGNIPGTQKFLEMLRNETRNVGALLIFDEVKTARLGPAGMQGMLGIEPDLTTLGKIIAGGLPTGAFGGRTDLMQRYNPRNSDSWKHAGTFNNNVCSMAAGCAALGEVFTSQRTEEFFHRCEAFRVSLNEMFAEEQVPLLCNGLGSMFAIHVTRAPLTRMTPRTPASQLLAALLHMELLLAGILIIPRGDMFLSLPMTDGHFERVRSALQDFARRYRESIASAAG